MKTYYTDASDKGMFPATFIPKYATHNLSLVTEFQVITNCGISFWYDTYSLISGAEASTWGSRGKLSSSMSGLVGKWLYKFFLKLINNCVPGWVTTIVRVLLLVVVLTHPGSYR